MARETRREAEAYELAAEQAEEAEVDSETDDSFIDPDHAVEAAEEPN